MTVLVMVRSRVTRLIAALCFYTSGLRLFYKSEKMSFSQEISVRRKNFGGKDERGAA